MDFEDGRETLCFEVRRRIHDNRICFDVFINGVAFNQNIPASDEEFRMWAQLDSKYMDLKHKERKEKLKHVVTVLEIDAQNNGRR